MDRNYLLQVTNELYRLTLLFPKKEPLRYRMRELADGVLADFISVYQNDNYQTKTAAIDNFLRKIDVIDGFFEIAKNQKWVKPSDMLSLQREYSKIREELIKVKKEKREEDKEIKMEETRKIEEKPVKVSSLEGEKKKKKEPAVSERQKEILKILEEKGKVQVWEIKELFSDISKRTLRRDFKSLLSNGFVERKGERNNTFYQIKDRTNLLEVGQP
jgi:DNA-binding transcriptional ArsR family regulator